MALEQRVVNNYSSWTQVGPSWTITGTGNAQEAYAYSGIGDASYYDYEIKISFDSAAQARQSSLTVWAAVSKGDGEVPPGYDKQAGYARGQIYLKDADGVEHQLWEQVGDLGMTKVLNASNINAYITKAGTYWLIFRARVKSCWIFGFGGDWYIRSSVNFWTVDLQLNDTIIEYELDPWDEVFERVEYLALGVSQIEAFDRADYFTLIKTTPVVSKDEKLLAAKSDGKVYDFAQGDPEGRFDTKDIDLGFPGVDKTADLVTFGSYADAPHTVEVWVSTDSGLTWTFCGQAVLSKGTTGMVGVWATHEKFRISFRGIALQLDSYSLYAIPRGREGMPEEEE